jgi:hypothetical protein
VTLSISQLCFNIVQNPDVRFAETVVKLSFINQLIPLLQWTRPQYLMTNQIYEYFGGIYKTGCQLRRKTSAVKLPTDQPKGLPNVPDEEAIALMSCS